MAITAFEFGFVLKIRDQASAILRGVREQVEGMNKAVAKTASLREGAANLAVVGLGAGALGAAIALPLKDAVEHAADVDAALQHLRTTLDDGVAGQREYAEAVKFAEANSIKFNVAQTDIVDNLFRSKSFIGDWNAALANTAASLAVAKGNLGDAKTVGEQLAIVFNDFGDKTKAAAPQIQHFSDVMAFATRKGAFHDVGQLNEALSLSVGAAKAAGIGYEDLVATIQAFSAVGLQGSEAGTAVVESLQAFARGKLQKDLGVALATFKNGSLDVIGTFVNLRKEVGSGAISVDQFQRSAKALGIRGERALALNVDDLVKFQALLHDPSITGGAALKGAEIVLAGYNEQVGQLAQKFDSFKDKIGSALIPAIEGLAVSLGKVVDFLNEFADKHPAVFKFIVTFTAISSAVLLLGGGLALASSALLGFVSFLPAIAAFSNALRLTTVLTRAWAVVQWLVNAAWAAFSGFGPALLTFVNGIRITTIVTKAWTVAQWALDAAMNANPIGIAIAGIALLVAGAILIIKHWSAVRDFFLKTIPQAFTWGVNLLKTFAAGIESAALVPIHALAGVLHKMRAYLPFSPAKEGPLRDLNRIRIVETIANTIKPAPLVTAIRRTALATLVAAPLIAGASAGASTGAGNASAPVTINYTVHVTGVGNGDDLARALKPHAREIAEMIARVHERSDRRSF